MGIDAEMFVRTKTPPTPDELRHICYHMCAIFGSGKFFIDPKRNRRALEVVESWEQDGPTIEPRKGETFIKVNMWTRYWGPGYERGDLAFILTLAEWLERKFLGAEVWYGGDSSGVCAEKFDRKARAALLDHAASESGADYRIKGNEFIPSDAQVCEFCGERMTDCRWGPQKSVGYICAGCDLHRLVSDGVVTESVGQWPDEKKEQRS